MRLWSFDRWTGDIPIAKHARAAVRNGFAVVFLRPGGKEPLCPLTARERKKAGPDHPCGVAHASTDERWVLRKARQLSDDYGQLNLGIAAHASGVVVIDADTPEEVESVSEFLRQLGEDAAVLANQPTVKTPGKVVDGVWVHAQGTHWYFNRPDGLDLPEYPGEMALPGGAVMRWGNSYTLVPPSVRDEGPYISLAEYIGDVPLGLAAMIRGHVQARIARTVELLSRYHDDRIVEWSLKTPWHTLLEPDGWSFTGKLDRQCGCPVWRRPGDDLSTDRSAIAHEDDCTRLANVEGHGALHVFSDNPPGLLAEAVARGQRTFTKLQYAALTHYDGDESAAKLDLGLEPDYGDLWEGAIRQSATTPDPYTSENVADWRKGDDQVSDQEERRSDRSDTPHPLTVLADRLAQRIGVPARDAKQELGREWLRREARIELDLYLGHADGRDGSTWLPRRDLLAVARAPIEAPPNNGVLERSDGATLFPAGRLHQLFGQSEAGKTFLMLAAIAQRAALGQRSLYCDFEDTIEMFIRRYRVDLGIDPVPWIESGLVSYANPAEPPSDIAPLLAASYDLIVVDSLSEVVASIADGSMKDGALIRRVLRKFRELADAGASVVIIAHGSEKVDVPTSSLGASEIRQAMTGQDILLANVNPFSNRAAGRSLIYVTKDRTSATGGDTDISPRAVHKSLKRLWGAMVVTPSPPDELLGRPAWHTTIEIEPAAHVIEPAKPPKIQLAETAVITYLLGCPDERSRVADLIDDVSDEDDMAERTLRRAIRKLIDDGMAHVTETIASPTGGKPSPVIKLGPAPEEGATP